MWADRRKALRSERPALGRDQWIFRTRGGLFGRQDREARHRDEVGGHFVRVAVAGQAISAKAEQHRNTTRCDTLLAVTPESRN
jgi:hypothetical protein